MSHSSVVDAAERPAAAPPPSRTPPKPAPLWVALLAEGIGTFGLVFAGCGAIMINTLSNGQITHVGVGLVFGLVVAAMIYATGHLSGAHLNPAVTLGFVLARHFPLRRLVGYWLAQLLGAVAASACLRLLLGDVARVGATLPAGTGGAGQAFGFEVLLTFFLMFVIMAVATDTRAVGQAAALAIGATVGLEALFAGPISGASMNPARSLAPALVSGTWTAQWVYVLAPLLGAAGGALIYRWLRVGSQPPTSSATQRADVALQTTKEETHV
jgi:MIP family channel proteins